MPDSTTTTATWRTTIDDAYNARIEPDSLKDVFKSLGKTSSPPSRVIIQTLLRAAPRAPYDKDPLIARYLNTLLAQHAVQPGELLIGLLHNSAFTRSDAESSAATAATSLPTLEEKVFEMIKVNVSESYFSNTAHFRDLILGITKWVHTIAAFEVARQVDLGPVHAISTSAASMYGALGLLAYTIFSHGTFRKVEKLKWWSDRRSIVVEELEKFSIHVLQIVHPQLSAHLRALTIQRPFLQTDDKGRPSFTADQIQASYALLPAVNTRAGLFIWLSACLDSRPLTDEATMRNHILVRYQDNVQNAAIGLILAAFDVLSRPQSQPGPRAVNARRILTSFLCNKLPLMLASLGSLMGPQSLENAVSMALLSLSSDTGGLDQESIQQTKLSFLRACVLHEVISQAALASIMPAHGDAAPLATRLNRSTLTAQCTSNLSKLDGLLADLEQMNGNAGAVSACVVDLVQTMCNTKDITSLKDLAIKLLRRLASVDIILQYAQLEDFVHPICQLLNDWTPDQEQSDFQPPYDDFANIYLLLSAIIHRYGLSSQELGLSSHDTFLDMVINAGTTSFSKIDLTEKQNTQLSLWIQGLYATDEGGEIIGISDEVYSTCPPQSFYLLVPTIFEQTVLACKAKALTMPVIKAGLEFLLEPFLLPSLVAGLRWLAASPWKDNEDTAIRIQILEKLIKPVSTSQDAQVMHKAALTIAAVEVERSLQHLVQTSSQKKKEANALIQLLRPYCDQADLAYRSSLPQESNVISMLRTSVQDLVAWTTSSAMNPPPKFDGQLITRCLEVTSPGQTLKTLIEEVVSHLNDSTASAALDICSALLIAPDPQSYVALSVTLINNSRRHRPLIDYLRAASGDAQALLSAPLKQAEALIRLQRHVEAHTAVSDLASQLAMVTMSMPQQAADQVMQDLTISASDGALAAGVLPDGTAIDSNAAGTQGLEDLLGDTGKLLDLSSADGIFDFKIGNGDDGSQLGAFTTGEDGAMANPDDDIFGDLDMTDLGGYDFS